MSSIFPKLFSETLQRTQSYKSVLSDRERDYCNRLIPCRSVQLFPHEAQDQQPYPRPRISVNSCPQPFTYPHPKLNERQEEIDATEPPTTPHLTRAKSTQYPVQLMLLGLSLPYLDMWYVRNSAQEPGNKDMVLIRFDSPSVIIVARLLTILNYSSNLRNHPIARGWYGGALANLPTSADI
jgi:hypothetical protein